MRSSRIRLLELKVKILSSFASLDVLRAVQEKSDESEA